MTNTGAWIRLLLYSGAVLLFAGTYLNGKSVFAGENPNNERVPIYHILVIKDGHPAVYNPFEDLSRDECSARVKTFKLSARAICVLSMEIRNVA